MNHDDFARHGTDLLERVREQVNAPRRLRQLGRQRRTNRIALVAVAAAAAIVVIVTLAGLLLGPQPIPPANQSTTTTLRSLPLEASIVLLDGFTVDGESGCSGEGRFAVLTGGAAASLVADPNAGPSLTLELSPGVVIDGTEVRRLGEIPIGAEACRFALGTLTNEMLAGNEVGELFIDAGIDPGFQGMAVSGQRITWFLGGDQ